MSNTALDKPRVYKEVQSQQPEQYILAEDINQLIANVEILKGGGSGETPVIDIKTLNKKSDDTILKLNAENENRINEDSKLQSQINNINTNIDNEVSTRAQTDANLQNQINTERAERTQADTTEKIQREQADTTLQQNINNEASTREKTDTSLQTQITELNQGLVKETKERKEDDAGVQNQINDLKSNKQNNLIGGHNVNVEADVISLKGGLSKNYALNDEYRVNDFIFHENRLYRVNRVFTAADWEEDKKLLTLVSANDTASIASEVAYNNADSYLEVNNVQNAIDKLSLLKDEKQDKLTAVKNITIIDNAISSKNPHILNGRNLMEVLKAASVKNAFIKLREKSSKGDFDDLMLGDYIDLDSLTDGEGNYLWNEEYQNLRCQIAAFDHYYRVGDQDNTTHHVVMQFKNCFRQKRMHSTDSNAGGYVNKELFNYLNGSFKNGLINAIGITPLSIRRLLDTYGGWAWASEIIFLPTEAEVWGHQAWSQTTNQGIVGCPTGTSIQYPIFSMCPQSRIKFFNGNRQWWWVGSPGYNANSVFAVVDGPGIAGNIGASVVGGGVAPAFCI
ncbi:DUF6273 domain-containing protein [uncultured Brachyspira sp.]|uniref:DUF6273 domain-containing protein n=1 Tax=uncultured Brachyspira sp. TaxID=221953 RepID=UPI00321FBF05